MGPVPPRWRHLDTEIAAGRSEHIDTSPTLIGGDSRMGSYPQLILSVRVYAQPGPPGIASDPRHDNESSVQARIRRPLNTRQGSTRPDTASRGAGRSCAARLIRPAGRRSKINRLHCPSVGSSGSSKFGKPERAPQWDPRARCLQARAPQAPNC